MQLNSPELRLRKEPQGADIDFISSAVPPEELQAALEDEDFSMGSDISSDELHRAIPQEEYDQMDFDQDTALQIQAAMDLLEMDSEDNKLTHG